MRAELILAVTGYESPFPRNIEIYLDQGVQQDQPAL